MPQFPDTVLKKFNRSALVRAKVTGKVIGWHSFRHSLATHLRSLGIDVKVAQQLLRHANLRVANVVRHTDGHLLRTARARVTFSRMSVAFAVQMKGLGF